jgi:hypothetical protein
MIGAGREQVDSGQATVRARRGLFRMNRTDEIAKIKRLVGQPCIFKEKLLIRHVRVTEVVVDDWGARLLLEVLETPGFESEMFSKLNVSASWEIIGVSDRSIGASYVSWLLIIRPDLVERILLFAKEPHDVHDLMQYVNKTSYSDD